MHRVLFVALLAAGCAVDPSGIPADEDGGSASDLSVPDGPVTPDLGQDQGTPEDLGPIDMGDEADQGVDSGPPDLGPPDLGPPDLGPPDLGPPDMGPPDLGPPDLGPPDMGPPDLGPPDMFMDGGCGMPESCNGRDDDCDGAIDELPGGPRGENVCDSCLRRISPAGGTYQVCNAVAVRWTDARDVCQAAGYALVTIDSMAEDAYVDSILPGSDDYWIGLNDRDTEGTFEWVSGTPFGSGSFSDWEPGEPNNAPGFDGDCVRISRGDGNRWRDDDCRGVFQAENRFVCEAP